MNDEEKTYNCERCKHKTLTVTKGEYGTEGRCSNCGYHFREVDYFKMINKYAGIMAMFAIGFMLISLILTDGQIADLDRKTFGRDVVLSDDIYDMNNTIANITTDIGGLNTHITNILSRISTAETNINTLKTLTGEINIIQGTLTGIDENISKLWIKTNSITGEDLTGLIDTNITFVYYANQTGATRYCDVNFSVTKKSVTLKEIKYMLNCPEVNITLVDWNSTFKPQIYKYQKDDCMLYWFGINDKVEGDFRLVWNITEYNTSKIGTNIKHLLQVNSVFVETPEIYVKEIG